MNSKIIKVSAIISGISGLVILGFVIYPIASYEYKVNEKMPQYVSPEVEKYGSSQSTDFTKPSNWFPKSTKTQISSKVGFYTLTIPKLGIEKATVKIGGEDLSESLVQYFGTAVPGKLGNSVIFGHSILPQFYDPENYLAVFSTLPTLEKGDEIITDYDGVSYKYRVEEMFEVSPEDIQILEQNTNDSFLTLITCTPPGHPLKPRRLVVRARIVPLFSQANADTSNRLR